MAALYASVALLLFFLSFLLTPNANSLHRLYRDRLSKAFLFDPKHFADGQPARVEASLDQGRDFLPLDRMKLSDLFPLAPNEDAGPATGERTGARSPAGSGVRRNPSPSPGKALDS